MNSFLLKKLKISSLCCAILMLCGILSSCGPSGTLVPDIDMKSVDEQVTEYLDEHGDPGIALAAVASGEKEKKNDYGVIDYSNTSDGYIMACFRKQTDKQLRAQVTGPETSYVYVIRPGEWNIFPLSDGEGKYTATLYENVSEDKYAAVLSVSFDVSFSDDKAPFLRPNQYVDYSCAPRTVVTAQMLCSEEKDSLGKVAQVYSFVVNRLKYDYDKAATVQTGYLPVLDSVLDERKGICFDYAALMTGMLRSQGVPCRLVTGYAGEAYHAWISVWVDTEGWIDKVIFFDGESWQMMDPTYASNRGTKNTAKLIGDGETYQVMYFY